MADTIACFQFRAFQHDDHEKKNHKYENRIGKDGTGQGRKVAIFFFPKIFYHADKLNWLIICKYALYKLVNYLINCIIQLLSYVVVFLMTSYWLPTFIAYKNIFVNKVLFLSINYFNYNCYNLKLKS